MFFDFFLPCRPSYMSNDTEWTPLPKERRWMGLKEFMEASALANSNVSTALFLVALPGSWLFRKGQRRCCFGLLESGGGQPDSGGMEWIHVLGQGADWLWLCLALWHVQFLRIFLLLSSSAGDLFGNRPAARDSAMVDRLMSNGKK